MRLTIFAATGGIGRHLLAQAVTAGHEVTAVVRNPAKLAQDAWDARDIRGARDARNTGAAQVLRDVRVITADLTAPDPAALRSAVDGADAVLSALGPGSQAEAGIAAPGTRAIVVAMRATGVRRIVAVSAAPVSTTPSPGRPHPPRHDPGEGLFMRHFGTPTSKRLLGRIFADLAAMEDVLRDSGLDWTVIRPPRLTDQPLTTTYRTAFGHNLKHGTLVSRADVAHCMLHALSNPDTLRQSLGIAH